MSEMVKFNFHGDDLDVVTIGSAVHVSIRRVCEVLEVDFSSQLAKLKKHRWAVMVMIPITGPDGKTYETACVDLRTLSMWLATITASKVKEAAREKLERYQAEAADVIAAHFFPPGPGLAKVDAPALDLAPVAARFDALEAKVDIILEGQERVAGGVSVALTILKTHNESVAELARVIADTREYLARTAAQKGLISEEQAAHIRAEVDALAKAWVETGWARSVKAAFGELVQEFFGYVGWGRLGERIDGLPEDRYPRALAFLDSQRRSLRRVKKPAKAA